jgi:hypothetical protein
MNQILKNIQMEQMLTQLQPMLQFRDKLGYVAARNTRFLKDALAEFLSFKEELIRKYGEEEICEGAHTGRISISPDSPNFKAFTEEFEKIADIEHEVELMTLTYDEVIGILSGEEMLALDWMLKD